MSGRELGSGGDALFDRVAEIIESARSRVARTVNTAMVHTYWLVGREIVEVEQAGETRGGYGDALIAGLAARLTERFGRGFTSSNLERMRQFYRAFPSGSRLELRPSEIGAAVRHQSMSLEIGASAGHSSTLPWFSFVLVHLKFGKLTHQDLGQMQMYAHFFDRFQRVDGEGPTIGIVLCSDKNDAMVKIMLPEDPHVHGSRYQLYLPTEAELRDELEREREEAVRILALSDGEGG